MACAFVVKKLSTCKVFLCFVSIRTKPTTCGRCFPVQPFIPLGHAFIIPSAHKTETPHKDVEARKQRWQAEVLLWQITLDFYGIKRWRAKIEISNSSWISVSWFIDYGNCYGLEFEFFSFAHPQLLFRSSLPVRRTSEKKSSERIARKMASKTIQSWKQKSSMGIAGRREAMTWGWACEHDESVQTSTKTL